MAAAASADVKTPPPAGAAVAPAPSPASWSVSPAEAKTKAPVAATAPPPAVTAAAPKLDDRDIDIMAQRCHAAIVGLASAEYDIVIDTNNEDQLKSACLQCYVNKATGKIATYRLPTTLTNPAILASLGQIYRDHLASARRGLPDDTTAPKMGLVFTGFDKETREIVFTVSGYVMQIDTRTISAADKLVRDEFNDRRERTKQVLAALRKQLAAAYARCDALMAALGPLPEGATAQNYDWAAGPSVDVTSDRYTEEEKAYTAYAMVWEREIPVILGNINRMKDTQLKEPEVHGRFIDKAMPAAILFAAKHNIAFVMSYKTDAHPPEWAHNFAGGRREWNDSSVSMRSFFNRLVPSFIKKTQPKTKGKTDRVMVLVLYFTPQLIASLYIS